VVASTATEYGKTSSATTAATSRENHLATMADHDATANVHDAAGENGKITFSLLVIFWIFRPQIRRHKLMAERW
jgi:hypothetical protein